MGYYDEFIADYHIFLSDNFSSGNMTPEIFSNILSYLELSNVDKYNIGQDMRKYKEQKQSKMSFRIQKNCYLSFLSVEMNISQEIFYQIFDFLSLSIDTISKLVTDSEDFKMDRLIYLNLKPSNNYVEKIPKKRKKRKKNKKKIEIIHNTVTKQNITKINTFPKYIKDDRSDW